MSNNTNAFGSVLSGAINASRKDHRPDDILDSEGFRCCPVCGERKETVMDEADPNIPAFLKGRKLGVPCACARQQEAEREAEKERRRVRDRIAELTERGITDRKYLDCRFENDERPDSDVSVFCRYFVDAWDHMKETGRGVLFYGSVGTGKTFHACCIANELIERRQVPVLVTSFAAIVNLPIEQREWFMGEIARCPLAVIDDLDAERKTEFVTEQVFRAVDARYRAKLPTIFTTNLDVKAMKEETATDFRRIYDRILGMCPVRLPVVGESRRQKNAEDDVKEERARFAAYRAEQRQIPAVQ